MKVVLKAGVRQITNGKDAKGKPTTVKKVHLPDPKGTDLDDKFAACLVAAGKAWTMKEYKEHLAALKEKEKQEKAPAAPAPVPEKEPEKEPAKEAPEAKEKQGA